MGKQLNRSTLDLSNFKQASNKQGYLINPSNFVLHPTPHPLTHIYTAEGNYGYKVQMEARNVLHKTGDISPCFGRTWNLETANRVEEVTSHLQKGEGVKRNIDACRWLEQIFCQYKHENTN